MEKPVEGVGPLDTLDAGRDAGLLLGEFFALPDGDVFAGFLNEQDFTLLRIDGIRHEQQRGFLLIDAG